VRLHSNQEVIDEIVRLSKEYGIITPYTSYLADERQDNVVHPMVSDGTLNYRFDTKLLREGLEESRRDLYSLSQGDRGVVGEKETHRAINSKEYQLAARAPSSSQSLGGLAGGGFGGGGGRAGGTLPGLNGPKGEAVERSKVGLDYLSLNGLMDKDGAR